MLNIFAISGLLIIVTSSVMALSMLIRPSSRTHLIWGVFCITVFAWGLGVYNIAVSRDPTASLFWWKVAYAGVIFIPIIFTHFTHNFIGKKNNLFLIFLYIVGVFYLINNLFTDFFIKEVHSMFDGIYYLSATPLYNSYLVLFIILIIYCHIRLLIEYSKVTGLRRQQIQYFFLASFIGFFGGSFSFLPVYEINIYPYLNLTVFLYPIIMGYAIFKYQLMNIKVITTQLFIVFLWAFIFVRMILAPFGSHEQILNGVLLLMTIFVGILLIKSVVKEIKSREEVEKLAKELGVANERLKELDKLKSEFVSIASHQLRSPLTSIKGYASLVLDGSYGKVPDSIREAVDKIFHSSQALVIMIEDFLNVSRIEQGRMKFELSKTDLNDLIGKVIGEQSLSVERAGLSLSFSTDQQPPYVSLVDLGKIRQVVTNLIDNAVKYTPKGSISVRLSKDKKRNKIIISVADTGMGIDKETLPTLFGKFTRAKGANKVNVIGTGLGLYIVKEIVKGHHGRAWVESDGIGKGSTFFVELDEDYEASHAVKIADFAETM